MYSQLYLLQHGSNIQSMIFEVLTFQKIGSARHMVMACIQIAQVANIYNSGRVSFSSLIY